MPDKELKRSSPAAIAVAWVIVVLPAAWGLNYTVASALKIFSKAPPAPLSAPASPAPAVPASPALAQPPR